MLENFFKKKLSLKISSLIFLLGIFLLILSSLMFYYFHNKNILKIEKKNIKIEANILSKDVEKFLLEKAKIIITLAYSPIIKDALIESNNFYSKLTKQERLNLIKSLNKKWMMTNNQSDPFILKYINNKAAQYLKLQENIFPDEYGEIFVTNKFGALVASTSKLTTFRHDYKLWWKEAYNNGKGAIFFDDRGYDFSAKTYVLGIVVPVKNDNDIIGILKANLAILNGIAEVINNYTLIKNYKIQLIRSKGRIIYEKGKIPLINKVEKNIINKINGKTTGAFFYRNYLIGFSKITFNKAQFNVQLGGTKESIDHKLGNKNEQWYVLVYLENSIIQKYICEYTKFLFFIGFFIIFILAILSYILGLDITRPINRLIKKCKDLGNRNFNGKIDIKRDDEIGLLASTINEMAQKLNDTMVSKKLLEEEIEYRKRLEENLKQVAKLESIGSLTAGIAHDFNNILTIISGCLEISMLSAKSDKTLERNLNKAMDAVKRAQNLVNQLLAFARKQPAFPSPIDVVEEIKKLEKMLKELIYEHIKIFFEYKCDNVVIFIDKSQLEQVLVNLVVNARDAVEESDKDKKVIIVRVEKIQLNERNIVNLKKGEYVKISVIDNGKGMSKEVLERIFEPFFTTKKIGHGTGLGLSTVYGIVKQNNGGIMVRSKLGEGTTFEIYFPIYKDLITEKSDINGEIDELPKGDETILIVEDEKPVRDILKNLLEKLGYKIILASNGKEGLEIYKNNFKNIDLIISDIIMPEMDGKSLYNEVFKINKNVKIIYISGYPDNIIEAKGIDIRGKNFIQKPFTLEKLAYKIREILDN